MSAEINIAIAGLGTVGAGVVSLLQENAALHNSRSGASIRISAVSARDKSKNRGVDLSGIAWADHPLELVERDDVDVIVELIGGEDGIALDLCRKALEAGKHVVTANKALIAKHGNSLAQIADTMNVSLLCEAAVAGGIPILAALRNGLAANRYTRIAGIMNGTCNYILSQMQLHGSNFDDVLADAQAKGYAETPPDLDIDGIDAAHKLAILASTAYGTKVDFDGVFVEGIRNITAQDIALADELGYTIRLLGIAEPTDDGVLQRVHPCLVPLDSMLGQIHDAMNAIEVQCDALGPAVLTGAGAGAGPTASAVVADLLTIARGIPAHCFGVAADQLQPANSADMDAHIGESYIRLKVRDESGVLANITSQLNNNDIGIETIIQHADDAGAADIAIITHEASESAISNLINQLVEYDAVLEKPHRIRVEE